MKIALMLISAILLLTGCAIKTTQPKPALDLTKLNWFLEAGLAEQEAQKVFEQAKNSGTDFSKGPCLSNALYGNPEYPETMWVLDIAHNPRTKIDDLPENQCSAFREGKAKNFIEMDKEGNILRVYSPYLKGN